MLSNTLNIINEYLSVLNALTVKGNEAKQQQSNLINRYQAVRTILNEGGNCNADKLTKLMNKQQQEADKLISEYS